MKLSYPRMAAIVLAFASLLANAAEPAPKATAPDPLSAEAFFANETTQAVTMSPSGRYIAIEGHTPGERTHLKVIDLEGKEPPRIIAKFDSYDVVESRWYNEDWILFKVKRKQYSSNTSGVGLWAVRRDGERTRRLIKQDWKISHERVSGNTAVDASHRMVSAIHGTEDIVLAEAQYNNREYTHTTLKTMNISTGGSRNYFKDIPEPPERVQSWTFDNSGRVRMAMASRDGRTRTYWFDLASKTWRKIGDFGWLSHEFTPNYINEKGELFVDVLNSASLSEIRKFDFATGMPDKAVLLSLPGFDADNAEAIKDPGSDVVHGLRLLTDSPAVAWFNPKMQAIQNKVDGLLAGRVNTIWANSYASPETVLIYSNSDTEPGDFLMYRVKQDKFERIASVRPEHRSELMGFMELHRTRTRDGADLPVWITKTEAKDAGPRPAVLLVHGGPWVRGATWSYDAEAQFLATRGYVVIQPEFRGSTGFGQKHHRAGWKQWGQRMQDDLVDALKFAVDKGWVDSKRVCIAGASYGGYATLMGLARDKDLFKCGVAWAAVTDPRLMFEVYWSDIGDDTKQHLFPDMIGDPEKDAAMLKANAPLEHAAKIKAPLLLAYGGRDDRVPLVHGELMRTKLLEAGAKPEWVVYDEEGHGWAQSENQIDFWKRVEKFLGESLKK